MAKAARAAMKSKIRRLTSGEPKAKVDASTWSPPEMMNTGAKVGMRPISRRAFRKGGKVIEKCEGGPAKMRADRKQRKAGGRSLVTDLINRNDKKANMYREGGDAHVGGYKRGGDVAQDKAMIKKALRQHDEHMHGGKHEEIKLKKGGSANWIAGAIKHPGALRKSLGVKQGEKIPAKKLAKATHSSNPKLAKRARLAETLKKLHKADGGSTTQPPKGEESDFDRKTRELMPPPKQGEMPADADMRNPVTGAPRTGRKKGGGTYFGGTRPTGGRMPRKSGGRAKDRKTNIVISINAQPKDQQQPMMPKMPTPSPLPVPPVAPPAMGAGAPPMPMPPMPSPPPGLAGGAPGMPPLPRKRGGRAYRSYKDMDAGALSGMGRLEKTEIEHGKRVGRLSGGRARSYKDMDAGALSGMGRIEKTAIQKHKR
jgi:hypothetical protein